ncbi:hypothetical protein [Streptomyces chilikensis]|uniref:hypothetical protein n=1 Tax=Streptomyces chilikensis TaxID=1194079 RepID=UPI000A77AFBF|nr:hypothetical protein [Streptomyces chilikensis]
MDSDFREGEFSHRLRELWIRSGVPVGGLLAFGRRPRVGGKNWSETEVRSWFDGSALPVKDWQFRLLVEYLEERAESRNEGYVKNSVEFWHMLYRNAVEERHGIPPRRRSGNPPRTSRERDTESANAFLREWRWDSEWFSGLRRTENFGRLPGGVAASVWGILQRRGHHLPVTYMNGELDPSGACFGDEELERAHERLVAAMKRFAAHSDALVWEDPDRPEVLVLPSSLEGREEAARGMRTAVDGIISAYFVLVELIRDRHLADDRFRFEPTGYGRLAAFPA